MKKLLILPLSLLASSLAFAGPTLTAQSIPATSPQPSSMAITVNGAAGPACTLPKATKPQLRVEL